MTDAYREERLRGIIEVLRAEGRVSVRDLSREFRVSPVTVRSDLAALQDRGLVVRTHGGGIATEPVAGPEEAFAIRAREQVAEKSRIGTAAAGLVHDGDVIALDASTSALQVARHIRTRRELTVVTNSLRVALELLAAPSVTVILPGGTLRRESISLQGDVGREVFQRYNVQTALLGARGLSVDEGLTDVSTGEVEIKRLMVESAKEVVGLVDHTKWGRVALATFASLDQVTRIITDAGAPPELVEAVAARDVEVMIV